MNVKKIKRKLEKLDEIATALYPVLDEIYQLKEYVDEKTYKEITKKLNEDG